MPTDPLHEFARRGQAAQHAVDQLGAGRPAAAPIESRSAIQRREFTLMAQRVQGRAFRDWPGWSTGQTIIVALILNRFDVLQAMQHTMLEAFHRNDLFTPDELQAIARDVRE